MRRKLSLLLMMCLLFANCISVSAADTLPIAKSNRYTLNYHASGVYEYVVPYTANFEIQLAGSQGSGYYNKAGGAGYLLTKTFRLHDGDVIRAEVGKQPDYYLDGDVLKIPGGQESKLYINGELVWTAGGGAGQIVNNIAPVGAKTVDVQNGNGTTAGNWNTGLTVHYHIGNSSAISGCYGMGKWKGYRTDTVPCGTYIRRIEPITSEITNNVCHCTSGIKYVTQCDTCGYSGSACANHSSLPLGPCGTHHKTATVLKEIDSPYQAQSGDVFLYSYLNCGKDERQILGYNNASYTAGNCYVSQSDGVSQSLTNTGDGLFAIKLLEQDELFYGNRRNADGWRDLDEATGAVTKSTDLELVVITTMPVDTSFKPTDGSPDGAEKVCVYFKRK